VRTEKPSIIPALRSLLGLGALLCGCTDPAASQGSLSVLLEAEDSISHGLGAGEDVEQINDGWDIRFDKYIVVLGEIQLHWAADPEIEAGADELFAVDLTQIPEQGLVLWELPELAAGRWDFGYHQEAASLGARRHSSVSKQDFAALADADLTHWLAGKMTQATGLSCPPSNYAQVPAGRAQASSNEAGHTCYENPEISFDFGISAATTFGPCEIDGTPGVSVPEGGTGTVAVTLHGDHLFFNGFPTGNEGGVVRLAQWLADCDLDLSAEVTAQELQSVLIADLPAMGGYHWGGAPIELQTAWDFVHAQLKTQGHMDGEGECEIDGAEHSH
jgi:hypothetical protein